MDSTRNSDFLSVSAHCDALTVLMPVPRKPPQAGRGAGWSAQARGSGAIPKKSIKPNMSSTLRGWGCGLITTT